MAIFGGPMTTAFESATRVAIEEIILARTEASKFGFFLSREGLSELTDDLFHLLKASRTLKAAGDRMLGSGMPAASRDRRTIGRPPSSK
jgi:hypothetical protein